MRRLALELLCSSSCGPLAKNLETHGIKSIFTLQERKKDEKRKKDEAVKATRSHCTGRTVPS